MSDLILGLWCGGLCGGLVALLVLAVYWGALTWAEWQMREEEDGQQDA